METKKFEALMFLIVPEIIRLITETYSWDELKAIDMFYNSQVYELLEQEDTKLWHLSPLTLFNMFNEEQKNGSFIFPEEV